MNYIVGSGYHEKNSWYREFFDIWKANTEKYTEDYYIVSTNRRLPVKNQIFCDHNLGHVGDLMNANRGGFGGWSASVCALAMVAYNCGKDLIYKESDCLWFGNVPEQLYKDGENKSLLFGHQMNSAPWMTCAQSTFLLRNDFIIDFLISYLSMPSDKDFLTEDKFVKLEQMYPDRCGRFSFGVDRMRPIPWDSDCFYVQQWNREELDEAKRLGLI